MPAPFEIPMTLAAKLGSLVVHIEEARSNDGHEFDWTAADQLMYDPEVQEFIEKLRGMSLVPVKRKELPR